MIENTFTSSQLMLEFEKKDCNIQETCNKAIEILKNTNSGRLDCPLDFTAFRIDEETKNELLKLISKVFLATHSSTPTVHAVFDTSRILLTKDVIPTEVRERFVNENRLALAVYDLLGLFPPETDITHLSKFCSISDFLYPLANVQRIIKSIPKEQLADSLDKTAPLLNKFNYWNDSAKLLKAVSNIEEGQREDIVNRVIFLMDKVGVSTEILRTVAEKHGKDLSEIAEKTASLIEETGIKNKSDKTELLKIILKEIDPKDLDDVIAIASPIMKTASSQKLKSSIQRAVAKIPPNEREFRIGIATPFIEKVSCPLTRTRIIQRFHSFPLKRLSGLAEKIHIYLEKISSCLDSFFLTIIEFPAHDVEDVVEKTARFPKPNDDLLWDVFYLPSSQRENVITNTLKLSELVGFCPLWEVFKIPQHQRGGFIEKITPLIESVKNKQEYRQIFSLLYTIEYDQLEDVIENALPLMEYVSCSSDMWEDLEASILQAIFSIPQAKRKEVIKRAIHQFSKHNFRPFLIPILLEKINLIPQAEDEEFLASAAPFLERCHGKNEALFFFVAIGEIPLHKRKVICEKAPGDIFLLDIICQIPLEEYDHLEALAAPLTAKMTDTREKAKLILAISQTDPKELNDVIEMTLSFLAEKTLKTSEPVDYFIRQIRNISQKQRKDVIEKTFFLAANTKHKLSIEKYLDTVSKIPDEQHREYIVNFLIEDFKKHNYDDSWDFNAFLRNIADIPKDQFQDVMKQAGPFLRSWYIAPRGFELISEILKTAPDEREDLFNNALTLIESSGGINEENVKEIFDGLRPLRPDARKGAVDCFSKLISEDDPWLEKISETLDAIIQIPPDHYDELRIQADPLIANTKEIIQKANIIKLVSFIPKKWRARIIANTALWIKDLPNPNIPDFLTIAMEIPFDELDEFTAFSLPFIYCHYQNPTRLRILSSIRFAPKEKADETTSSLKHLFRDQNNPLALLRFIPMKYKERAIHYMRDKAEHPRDVIYHLIDKYPSFLQCLHGYVREQLNASFFFAKSAIGFANTLMINEDDALFREMIRCSVSEKSANPKNPPEIFHQFITQNEDLLPCFPPESEGVKVNIDKLREAATAAPRLTYEDLPKVDRELLRKIFDRLKDTTIKKMLFGLNSIIPKLLRVEPNSAVRNSHFHLFSIIGCMAEMAPDVQDNILSNLSRDFLSHHEAQEQALCNLFNSLPLKFRTNTQNIPSLIDASIQTALHHIFYKNTLWERLINEGAAYSQNIVYLKNRLCKQLGLKHQIAFDGGTNRLPLSLIEMPTEKLLDSVVQELTPSALIDQLKQDFAKVDQSVIMDYLKGDIHDWFEEMEGDKWMLKNEGAKKLLQKSSYLR